MVSGNGDGDGRRGGFEFHREADRGGPRARAIRRPRGDAIPPRAERLPAHRSRQGDLPQLRPRRRPRGRALPLALRRHEPYEETVEYVDSIMADVRWLGFDWGPHL